MSHLVANSAALPLLPPGQVAQANESGSAYKGSARLHCSYGVLKRPEVSAMAANPLGQGADDGCDQVGACRLVFRRLFGHCFGGLPAPCGSSLFCFGFAALRVAVSLEILFGRNTDKICRDPP
jgi:hypothetical protein